MFEPPGNRLSYPRSRGEQGIPATRCLLALVGDNVSRFRLRVFPLDSVQSFFLPFDHGNLVVILPLQSCGHHISSGKVGSGSHSSRTTGMAPCPWLPSH